jgi:hypothetical protein
MEFLIGHKHLDQIIIGYLNRTVLFEEELLDVTSGIKVPSNYEQRVSRYIMTRGKRMWQFFRTHKSNYLPFYKDYARAHNVSDTVARRACGQFYSSFP